MHNPDSSRPATRPAPGLDALAARSNIDRLEDGDQFPEGFCSLPAGATILGYYTDSADLRWPYGFSDEGFWLADEFGWAMWPNDEGLVRALLGRTER